MAIEAAAFRLKVSMISANPRGRGGVPKYTRDLAEALRGRGIHVTVLAEKVGHAPSGKDKELLECWNRGIRYPFQIFHTLAKDDSDVVHVQHEFYLYGGFLSAALFPVLLLLCRMLGRPLVLTLHGVISPDQVDKEFALAAQVSGPVTFLRIGTYLFNRLAVLLSDVTIVHEDYFRDVLIRTGSDGRRIVVVPHGIESAIAPPARELSRRRIGLGKGEKCVLFFGLLARYKGLDTLVAALCSMAGVEESPRLVVAGSSHPRLRARKDYQTFLKGLQDKGKSCNIDFVGYVPDAEVGYYFAAADVMVLPYTVSMSSSGPLAMAIAYELPALISSKLALLCPIKNAVFRAGDSKDLTQKLSMILANPTLIAEILHEFQTLRAERKWDKVAARTASLYQGLLSNRTLGTAGV